MNFGLVAGDTYKPSDSGQGNGAGLALTAGTAEALHGPIRAVARAGARVVTAPVRLAAAIHRNRFGAGSYGQEKSNQKKTSEAGGEKKEGVKPEATNVRKADEAALKSFNTETPAAKERTVAGVNNKAPSEVSDQIGRAHV